MLDGPRLPDASLVRQMEQAWAVRVDGMRRVPGGEDSDAWAFEVRAPGARYFLKLRHGPFDPSAALVPAFLRDNGVSGVVAPLPTTTGALWHPFERDETTGGGTSGDGDTRGESEGEAGYTGLLYPFVAGETAARRGLTDDQWVEYGRFLARLHAVRLPADLAATVPSESFQPRYLSILREVTDRIRRGPNASPSQHQVAHLWHTHADLIEAVARRTVELAPLAAARSRPHVLCHSDIHRANVMVGGDAGLAVVDWDDAILAPRECDLMFVVDAAIAAPAPTAHQESLFWQGYGEHDIDWPVLAYYRYKWAVQDLADFAHRVFLRDNLGEAAKQDAATILGHLFDPGDEVDLALSSETHLES